MAIFTIAGLTLKEAWRKRTIVGALLLGLLAVGISLLLVLIRAQMVHRMAIGKLQTGDFAMHYVNARVLITLMALFFIRILGMLFAILLAGGAISGEIEQGLLSVILARPVARWQILVGKWIGLCAIGAGSALVWTALVWLSLRLQTQVPLEEILGAAPYLALYPILVCTLTLTLSTVFHRVLGTSIALIISMFAWADGIFNFFGDRFVVPALHQTANIGGLLMPQGTIAWWVKNRIEDITPSPFPVESPVRSSQFVAEFGQKTLHFAHLDGLYVAFYILVLLGIGILLFERREVS